MTSPPANEVRFTFHSPELADDELMVVGFTGEEAISRPYRFELDLLSENATVPFSALIDQPATLTIHSGEEPLPIHGIVADVQQGRPQGAYYSYRIVLVPRLWRLSLTHQSRVFQNASVPEIVRQVLQEAGLVGDAFRFALESSYPTRDYCTQYKETDLAFISRLLEYEGIQYFFEHGDEVEALVMTDRRGENPPVAGERSIIYRPGQGFAAPHEDTIHEFVFREQIVPGRVVLKDYNYRTPDADLRAESQLTDEMPGVYYDYGEHFKDEDVGKRLARVRNEELNCRRKQGTGEGLSPRLRAGHRFQLDEHYRLDLNQQYLVTEIRHIATQRGLVSMEAGEDTGPPYRNEFVCIPASVPFRPPRITPEPKLPGIMTAKVESAGGEYAYLDEQGRYRVKMPFDLADTESAGASKPIRLAQPYAGSDYGMHFPVHANAEMVFACVDGNVDRPLGLSTVPNPQQGSPVTSGNHTKNVIRTASQNEIYMEDEKGNERIKLYSPYKNSIIQLGSPNAPIEGIGLTTEATCQMHGQQGVVLNASPDFIPTSDIDSFKNALTHMDAALGTAALAAGFSAKALGTYIGMATTFKGWQDGLKYPGVYISGRGGVGMYSQNSVSAAAGPGGMGFFSAAGIDLGALAGVYLGTAAGGIAIFAGEGDVGMKAGLGDVELEAKVGSIKQKASRDINVEAGFKVDVKSGTEYKLTSDGTIDQVSKRDYRVESQQNVSMGAKGSIDLKAKQGGGGGGTVTIDDGIYLGSKMGWAEVKENGNVKISGNEVSIDAQKIELKAGPAKITLTAAGNVIIEGVGIVNKSSLKFEVESNAQVKLTSKAVAQLKGAISQIG